MDQEVQRNFMSMLHAKWAQGKFLCVGLDVNLKELSPSGISELERLCDDVNNENVFTELEGNAGLASIFCQSIINETKDIAAAFKPNRAFFARFGADGFLILEECIKHIQEFAPDVPVILDAKEEDIENTNLGYIEEAFDHYKADAITVHNYMGLEATRPFLDRKDKGIIVLAKTSNKGSGEFQDLEIAPGVPLYLHVARRVAEYWNYNGNCAVVVGATYPAELARVRDDVSNLPILIPGIGKQGGDLQKSVTAGKSMHNSHFLINVSRDVLYASKDADFAEAAGKKALNYHEQITAILSNQITLL